MRAFSSSGVKKPLALGAVLAVTGATAAFAFTGAPGTGGVPATNSPDLVSATLDADNAIGDREGVTFCFDEQLNNTFFPANFFVKTYDSDRFQVGQTALIVPSDGRCVDVTFNPNVDLKEQGSVGEVNAGAVTNLAARSNSFSNAPLTGSTLKQVAGASTGPDLVAFSPRQTDRTVNYTFDEQVNPASIVPASFKVVDNAGAEVAALAAPAPVIDNATKKSVRVTFPAGTDVAGAIRYSVARGAVRDLAVSGINGPDGPGDATTTFTLGTPGSVGTAPSARPVLESAAPRVDGSSQFVLDYTGDLGTFTAAGVVAVMDNGEVESANNVQTISGRTDQRLLSFPADGIVDNEPTAVVKIVSNTGAATTSNGNLPSPVSQANVGPGAPSVPGFSTAPDLLTTNIDTTASQAGFTYDEPVDPARIAGANNFVLLVANGAPLAGTSIGGTSSDKKTVFVNYAGSVSAGVGVGNANDAVVDNEGNSSVYASISTTNIPLPSTGTTTPPGVTPTPTATVGPPVVTPPPGGRQQPGLSATVRPKRDRRKPFRYTTRGTLRLPSGVSSAAGCQGKVRITVKRKGSGKTLSSRLATVKSTCKFSNRVTFTNSNRFAKSRKVRRRGTLRFAIRFQGNARLLPRTITRTARYG